MHRDLELQSCWADLAAAVLGLEEGKGGMWGWLLGGRSGARAPSQSLVLAVQFKVWKSLLEAKHLLGRRTRWTLRGL